MESIFEKVLENVRRGYEMWRLYVDFVLVFFNKRECYRNKENGVWKVKNRFDFYFL